MLTQWFDYVRTQILSLINERHSNPDPMLLPDHISKYRQLTQIVDDLEALPLASLVRFGDLDRKLTALGRHLVAQVCSGIGTVPPFVVSTLSSSYYVSNPYAGVVQVPAAEECSLLGLSILLHEFGHWVFHHFQADFDDFITTILDPYFAVLRTQIPTGVDQKTHEDAVDRLAERWRRQWLKEFVSDLFATWVVGATFPSQFMRHSFSHSVDCFADNGSHPADGARVSATQAILHLCGQSGVNELALFEGRWNSYVTHLTSQGITPGADYDSRYPAAVIEALADTAAGVFSLTVRRFDGAALPAPDVPALLREAWSKLEDDLAAYIAWEQQALVDLWVALGNP